MRFFLTTATVLLSVLGSVSATICDQGPFVVGEAGLPYHVNPEPQRFCESKWDTGHVITGIRVWWAKFQVKAVQFQFAGGEWGTVHGQNADVKDYGERTWGEDASIGLQLWNNKPDDGDPMDAVGKIVITEAGKEDFEAGGSKIDKKSWQQVNTGSGKLLAVAGGAGAWVTTLHFKFLESAIKSLEMTDMKLKENPKVWTAERKGMEDVIVSSDKWVKNSNKKGGADKTVKSEIKVKKDVTKQITSEETRTFGYSYSVTVGLSVEVPEIAQVSMETSHQLSYEMATMKSQTNSDTKGWEDTTSIDEVVKPQMALRCTAFATQGTYASDFEATITAYLANGNKYTYKNFGRFTSVGFARLIADCKQVPISEAPEAGDIEEADDKKDPKRSTRLTRFIASE